MDDLTVLDDIKDRIHTIRGVQVMFDRDLAGLYGVETRVLNQVVKRNIERFPSDFMFQLTKDELKDWKSQIVISNKEIMGIRNLPFVFTEQGVSMLSGILKSKKAIEVNIKIIRTFVAMRRFISTNAQIFTRLDRTEIKLLEHEKNFEKVFKALETHEQKQGIFFDGQVFDAYSFVSDLIRSAKESILLVDNYVDDSVLTLFSKAGKKVKVKIYTKDVSKRLMLDVEKFNSQYGSLEIKEFNRSHDRFLIIDSEVYHFGASLKDIGKKWFAFSKFDVGSLRLLKRLS